MLPSGPDYLFLRQDGPQRLRIEPRNMVLHRGLNELRPQRFSLPKLVASVGRQVAYRAAEPISSTSVIMPLSSQSDAEDVMGALLGLPNIDVFPALLPNLLDQVVSVRGRRLVIVVGDADLPPAAAYMQLAQALAGQNPQIEQRFCQELVATLSKAHGELVPPGFERSRLVVEERPGKATQLHVAEPTLKALSKSWQTLAQRGLGEPNRAPLAAPAGWGIGGLVLSDDAAPAASGGPALASPFSFAALTLRMATPVLQIDSGRILKEVATSWLAELADFDVSQLRRLMISVPWMAAAAMIASSFVVKGSPFPVVTYPDYLQGWQPQLTILEMLTQHEGPTLLIHMGRFPEVQMAALWR